VLLSGCGVGLAKEFTGELREGKAGRHRARRSYDCRAKRKNV